MKHGQDDQDRDGKESNALNPTHYSCYLEGDEVGMVEEPGGAWVPAWAFERLRTLYREK
jgi:hypothetical protein